MKSFNEIILRNSYCDGGWYLHLSDNDNKLLCRSIKKGTLSNEETVIYSDFVRDFDALITSDNTVHIVLGDSLRNIFYIKNENGKWLRTCVVNGTKSDGNIIFDDFVILRRNNHLGIMYTVTKDKKSILFFQKLDSYNAAPIKVGDVPIDDKQAFFTCDSGEDTAVFFSNNGRNNLGVKLYAGDRNEWSGFYNVIEDEQISDYFAFSKEERFYLCYKNAENLKICIFDKTELSEQGNRMRTHEKILTKRHGTNCSCPVMRADDTGVRLLWSKGNIIYSTSANNSADNWQRLKESRLTTDKELKICKTLDSEGVTEYDFFYIEDGTIMMYADKEYFKIQPDNEKMSAEKTFENIFEQNYFNGNTAGSREDIEREKMKIMNQLGISKSDDTFDFHDEDELYGREVHKFSSENSPNDKINNNIKTDDSEILNELKNITGKLTEIQKATQKYTAALLNHRKNTESIGKRKGSLAKMHKK